MEYSFIPDEKAMIVELRGEIDMISSEPLRELINGVIQRGNLRLVIDLAQVPFMNSSGLGALVASFLTLKRLGGVIRLCCVQPEVQRVFKLTRMDRAFEIFPTRAAALDFG